MEEEEKYEDIHGRRKLRNYLMWKSGAFLIKAKYKEYQGYQDAPWVKNIMNQRLRIK